MSNNRNQRRSPQPEDSNKLVRQVPSFTSLPPSPSHWGPLPSPAFASHGPAYPPRPSGYYPPLPGPPPGYGAPSYPHPPGPTSAEVFNVGMRVGELQSDNRNLRQEIQRLNQELMRRPAPPALSAPPTTPHRAPPTSRPSSSPRRRKAETPDLAKATLASPDTPAALGIGPLDDRNLLVDFSEKINTWAEGCTSQSRLSYDSVQNIHQSLKGRPGFGESFKDPMALLADQAMRSALVSAFVCQDIAWYTMSENLISHSGHHGGWMEACTELVQRWRTIADEDVFGRALIAAEQKGLYTAMKQAPDHREWRVEKARHFAHKLLESLRGLVSEPLPHNAVKGLEDIFILGYRIGFRWRMGTQKWVMAWPKYTDLFDSRAMVTTHTGHFTIPPESLQIHFAQTPTIFRMDFSSGTQEEEIVHKAKVVTTIKGKHLEMSLPPPSRGESSRTGGRGGGRGSFGRGRPGGDVFY